MPPSPAVGLVLQPYTARPGPDEWSIAPEILLPEATRLLEGQGLSIVVAEHVELSAEEKKRPGEWERLGLADGHLGRAVASLAGRGVFVLGLLGNCTSSLGMLAGLESSSASGRPLRVGLIWIDAHADFNTPETSLSDWLGGMPVSVASGHCLTRLRTDAGLEVPISTRDIVMMGQRDVDPLEQVRLNGSQVTQVSAASLVTRGPDMVSAVEALSGNVDVIYLHVDLDILDATEIPGSFFATPGGPTASELGPAIRLLVSEPKVGALGISSFPTAEEGRAKSMRSTLTLLRAAMDGLQDRGSASRR